MAVPRSKGKHREVRRLPARRSKQLPERYRRGGAAGDGCPPAQALAE